MSKTKRFTRKQLHRLVLRRRQEAKADRPDTTFRREHDAEMRKMLKGVDLERWYPE